MAPSPGEIPNEPISDDYGFGRGTPVDRRYIETFLADHAAEIRGSVLEVEDARYTELFGNGRTRSHSVVDIDAGNPRATLLADLCAPGSLPTESYDCIILTETLHLLSDPEACLANCWAALRRGGSLLVTVPALKRLSPRHPEADYWRFTPAGLELLMTRRWPGPLSVRAYGSLRSCIGFLLAHVVEDFDPADLDTHDPRFPLTITAHARKP